MTLTVLNPKRTNELATAAAAKIKEQIRKNDLENQIKRTAARKYNSSSSSSPSDSTHSINDLNQDEQEESDFADNEQFQSDEEDPELKGQFEDDNDGYENVNDADADELSDEIDL